MKNVSLVLVLLSAMIVSESSAGLKSFLRQPKKHLAAAARAIENKDLEPVAHAVENEVIEPAANGVNDHIVKPFFKGLKRKLDEHSEQAGQVAADVAHQVVVTALTGQKVQGNSQAPQQNSHEQKGEGERPAKRARH